MMRLWPILILPLIAVACKPPPDFDHSVEVIKGSTKRGAENARDAVEIIQDPEKRQHAAEQLKEDLKNPPRQFK